MKNILTAKRAQWFLLVAILIFGLAIRLAYLSSSVHAPDFNSPVLDPQLNDYWARALVTGDWTPPPHADDPEIRTTPYGRPPGYPWLLAGMYWISDGSYLVPRLVQVCVGLLNLLLVFFLGKRMFGSIAGLIAAFLMSVFWAAVYFEEELNSPVWEVCFSLSMVLSLLRWERTGSRFSLVLAGLLLGYSALMRPNILLPGCFVLLWVAWQQYKSGGFSVWRIITTAALYAGAAGLLILPVIARNWVVGREFVLISYYGGVNAYIGNNPESTGVSPEVPGLYEISGMDTWNCFNYPNMIKGLERHLGRPGFGFSDASRYFYNRALAFWLEHPGEALRLTLRKAWFFWGPHEISDSKVVHCERTASPVLMWLLRFSHLLALILAGALGWVLFRRHTPERNAQSITLVLGIAIGYFASVLPFFIAERYRFPVVPLLLPFAGYAFVLIGKRIKAGIYREPVTVLVAALLLYQAAALPLVPYTPNVSTWHLHRGIAYAAKGEHEAAEQSFQEAVREDTGNDEAYLQLGFIRAARGDHEGATEYYARAVAANPNNALACNNLGYEHYLKGDYPEAEQYYRQAIARQPEFTLAINNLGNLLLSQGDTAGALAHFEQVLAINKRDRFARYNIGNTYLEMGAYEKALEAYRLAFETNPSADIANNLGLALTRNGQAEAAIPWFEKALSLQADYPLAHFNLGNIYSNLGDKEKACSHYELVLQVWPEHAETLERKAEICSKSPRE